MNAPADPVESAFAALGTSLGDAVSANSKVDETLSIVKVAAIVIAGAVALAALVYFFGGR